MDEVGPDMITDYLVSRFYRAPEIIIGCVPDQKIDIWSAGVTLFELFTGQILFDGRNNSEILKQIIQIRGRPNQKLLKKAHLTHKYFNS